MTIDRVTVVGVALRFGSHGRPFRKHLHQQPALVDRLEHGHGIVATEQQRSEIVARAHGPRVGKVGRLGHQPFQ